MKCLVCMGILFAALGMIVAGPALAEERLSVEGITNPDGTGQMRVTGGTRPWRWEACTPQLRHCEPFATGRVVETAGASAGTVFRVRDAGGRVGVSPEWRGLLKAVEPPRVTGVIQADGFVSPVQGVWSGGWEGGLTQLQLAACVTETGEECVSISSPWRPGCALSASFAINPVFAGWYLRVADWQVPGHNFTDGLVGHLPFNEPPWGYGEVLKRSPTTSVAIVGQIAPAGTPPAGECGPPPAPIATISAEGIARVECGAGCSVALVGTRKGRRQLVTHQIREQGLLTPFAALEMKLPSAALARLGAGKLRLTVEIDGARWAQRTIRTFDS